VESDIAATTAGRVAAVLVQEGDEVKAGQVLARMDTDVLSARIRQARAEEARSREARRLAEATVAERRSALDLAQLDFDRTQRLFGGAAVAQQTLDRARTALDAARAGLDAAEAQVADAEAARRVARSQVQVLEAQLTESELHAPRDGRVLYRLVEPGEVIGAGGRILTIVDPREMFMVVFLPEADAGRVRLGAAARIALDAMPGRLFPAHVTFVAPEAQFTPKYVETADERARLVFRVKVAVTPDDAQQLRPGAPGVAYIRLDDNAPWPRP
jgi:HlyD family secretion protein